MAKTIPVIDLGPYLAGTPGARERTAAEVGNALETIGFYFIGKSDITPSGKRYSVGDVVASIHKAMLRFR